VLSTGLSNRCSIPNFIDTILPRRLCLGGIFAGLPRSLPPPRVRADITNDILQGRAGRENLGHARALEKIEIFLRNESADDEQNVVHAMFPQHRRYLRA